MSLQLASPPAAPRVTGFDLLLILVVTCSWGLNYPIMKFVVTQYPPSSFRALTFILGTVVVGLYAWQRGEALGVPQHERETTLRLSIPNMVLWHVGLVYGISLLNSGRAAIIGYTMPVWALLASVMLYRNPLTWRATLGVLCSLIATILLALDEMSHFAGQPLGLVFTFGAAISWGIGNAMMKHTRLSISSLALTFWSLAVGAVCFTFLAWVLERDVWRWPNLWQSLAIGYGDGYPRHARSGTPALVRGYRVSLIGRVSMDMIALDLEHSPEACVGDEVTLWGDGLPVEEVAEIGRAHV